MQTEVFVSLPYFLEDKKQTTISSVTTSSSVTTLFFGRQRSKLLFPGLLVKLNIGVQQQPDVNWFG